MIHLLIKSLAFITAGGLAVLTLWLTRSLRSRRIRSVLAGAVTAGALTLWVATVRHAALVQSAAQPMSDGQKLTPGQILACGFTGVFAIVTAAAYVVTAVTSRRPRQTAGETASAWVTPRNLPRDKVKG